MPEPRLILGIDLGTTSLKGILFDRDGTFVAHRSTSYPTTRHADGRVEQDANDWMEAFWTVVEGLLEGHVPADLLAIGICSQVNTYVFVDEAGKALAPAQTWLDGRCEEEAARLDALVDDADRAAWWPSGMAVSASHMLPRMGWIARNCPQIWARTAKVLSPKDYVLRQLTGRWTADAPAAFDLVDGQGRYIDALLALVPGAAERVAPLAGYRTVIGLVDHPRLPGCRAQVVNGTMDALGCLFGSGASVPGEGSYISGTSEIVALIGDRPGSAPGIVSFVPVDGWHIQAGPSQSGGDTLRWLASVLRTSHEEVLALAAGAERQGTTSELLFLPHLEGERAPFWDAGARGSFLGLRSGDGAAEMALAALEGVALSGRLLLDGCAEAIGRRPDALYVGGKGNSSDLWAQIRADVLGVPLYRVENLDTGSVGAAIMAGLGIGLFRDVAEGSRAFVRIERTFQPNPAMGERYARLLQRYLTAYDRLRPLYALP